MDADQGFVQKIFYVHVPMAIVALCGFVAGGVMGDHAPADARQPLGHALLRRDPPVDHPRRRRARDGVDLGAGGRGATGGSGTSRRSSRFLIVFLLYATYQPLRFSIEDPERQARYASVFAIMAGAFVPLNFIAVRLRPAYTHPRVLGNIEQQPAGPVGSAFYVPAGDDTAVRDAVEVRDDLQARVVAAAPAQAPARRDEDPARGAADARRRGRASRQTDRAGDPRQNDGYVAAAYLVFFAPGARSTSRSWRRS